MNNHKTNQHHLINPQQKTKKTNIGWSEWSDYTTCSVSCSQGVQQRFRRCLFDGEDDKGYVNKNLLKRIKKEFCLGYNIEQRNCNMFECTGFFLKLLPAGFILEQKLY